MDQQKQQDFNLREKERQSLKRRIEESVQELDQAVLLKIIDAVNVWHCARMRIRKPFPFFYDQKKKQK